MVTKITHAGSDSFLLLTKLVLHPTPSLPLRSSLVVGNGLGWNLPALSILSEMDVVLFFLIYKWAQAHSGKLLFSS